jgi:hypothetical protein
MKEPGGKNWWKEMDLFKTGFKENRGDISVSNFHIQGLRYVERFMGHNG